MGLIQIYPDDDDAEEPSLAKLESVGDARRKNYLSKALARANTREDSHARRPASAASGSTPPSPHLNLTAPARCISASASATAASSLSASWVAQTAASVAARTTRCQEPNLSDTLANTITTDMSVLRRRPSSAMPPRASRCSRRASSAYPPSSAAAAIAAAAVPAATLPRRPVSAAGMHGAASAAYPDLSAARRAVHRPLDTAALCAASTLSLAASAKTTSPCPNRLSVPCSPRPPFSPAAPNPNNPVSCRPTPASAPAASINSWTAAAAASRPSPSHHASAALSHARPSTASPSSCLPPSTTSPQRPRSSSSCTAFFQRPHPAVHPNAAAPLASHKPSHTLTAPPVPFSQHHLGAAHNPHNSIDSGRQVVRVSSGGGGSGRAISSMSGVLLEGGAASKAGDQAAHARAPCPAPARPLPQWTVHARAPEDLLQFEGRDRGGFHSIEGWLGGRHSIPADGGAAEGGQRAGREEEGLPVGATATAIFMAQTSGSLEGLKGLAISRLPTQIVQYLQTEGSLLKGRVDLSHNRLASLPFLRHTPSISVLLLSHNHMVTLPAPVFSPLSCLHNLDLSHNKLQELPSSLGGLRSLKHLDVSGNALEVLPTRFSELTGLVTLKVNNNRLFCLPQGLSCLTALESLEAVGNGMTGLPPNLGSCTRLTTVHLQHNSLTALPNSIKGLHTWLMDMHLDDNGFTVLPREVALLTKLTNLTLSGNPLLFPPRSIAAGGAQAVREFLAVFSTPGTSAAPARSQLQGCTGAAAVGSFQGSGAAATERQGTGVAAAEGQRTGEAAAEGQGAKPAGGAGQGTGAATAAQDHGSNESGAGGDDRAVLDPVAARQAAVGYQSHETTAEDVVASTQALCAGYNPENQGSLLLHMQFEAEANERQIQELQAKLAGSEERAAIAERDAAELAETLRRVLAEGHGAASRPGTAYEQGSAELARAVRVLEADLREATGELHMARQQLEEARRSEAEQRCLADAAVRDAGASVQSVQRASALEAELHAIHIKEAQLQQRLVRQLHEYKNMEDRCLKAESQLESSLLGEHGVAKTQLQSLREHVLVLKLEMRAKEDDARAREAALRDQLAQLAASLEASRLTMKDMCDTDAASARIKAVPLQAAEFFAGTYEDEAKKHRHAALSTMFPDRQA